jgi:O-acetyl-ADP-ribose deacetylase (regulator of RNase III)
MVQVSSYVHFANMIGQHGMKTGSNGPPIQYEDVAQCLNQLAEKAKELGASVHISGIGCGLAGGKWERMEPIVLETLVKSGDLCV